MNQDTAYEHYTSYVRPPNQVDEPQPRPTKIVIVRDADEVDEWIANKMIQVFDQSGIRLTHAVALQNYHINLFDSALDNLPTNTWKFLPAELECDPEPDDFDENQDFYHFPMTFTHPKWATYVKLVVGGR